VTVARQAIAAGAGVLWSQPGTDTDEAARLAADAGLTVVTRRCMGALHAQLGLGPMPSR
jgi:predicted CoA-binding protein